ncbi:regulatory helix-turn-helix LysR family protein [Saccharothrix texasensis]|uniref:Regulatory helix-turn-helix LysR family protein n=1 Tax=Saccharothrix texasensis TaxID=103734 RepID=A0A3N1HJB2_9PSEU|nr:regulatory helix-turn-helix LysR family protein [Saccharothrix texasensis]
MDLRHPRAAVAVADHLHFGRAAAALGMAQPPLSQAVKALETELGVSLSHRDTRNVHLTRAGEAFVADARAALSMVDTAARRARAEARRARCRSGWSARPSCPRCRGSSELPGALPRRHSRSPCRRSSCCARPRWTSACSAPPLPGPADDLELVPCRASRWSPWRRTTTAWPAGDGCTSARRPASRSCCSRATSGPGCTTRSPRRAGAAGSRPRSRRRPCGCRPSSAWSRRAAGCPSCPARPPPSPGRRSCSCR